MNQVDATSREAAREHLAAMNVLRFAKSAAVWLAIVAAALQLVSWTAVRYGETDRADAALGFLFDDDPGDATASPGVSRSGVAHDWVSRMDAPLVVAGFIGFAAACVVSGAFIISLLVSLSAGLGGAAGLARSCVWSLAALALVLPWVAIDPSQVQDLQSSFDTALSIVRYAVCPLLVIAFLLVAQVHYRRAYRKMTHLPPSKLPIHEV